VESFLSMEIQEEQIAEIEVPRVEIKEVEVLETYGKFSIEPLEPGFGATLGNPLRRVLLSSIPGAAVTWVKIDGVLHEYANIPHMKEDVLSVLQRVKNIRVKSLSDQSGTMQLEVTGPGEIHAGDLSLPPDLEIMNPDLELFSLDSIEGKVSIELNVEHGKGYVAAASGTGLPIGTLPVDAIYGPVRRVNYTVEHTRVGQVTDYDRLLLEVWTDGTISPLGAVQSAAQILMEHFTLFSTIGQVVAEPVRGNVMAQAVEPDVYNTLVDKLELSSRTVNCLKRAGIYKVGEVLERNKSYLLGIRNFGERSWKELISQLEIKGFPIPSATDSEGEEGLRDPVSTREIQIPEFG
jgi:DNA-directed RNA polymerase subunit alpha